jgi:hypothetical protein
LEQSHSRTTKCEKTCDICNFHFARNRGTPDSAIKGQAKHGAASFATVHRAGIVEQSHSRTTKDQKACDIPAVHFARTPLAPGHPNGPQAKSGAVSFAIVHRVSLREQSHFRNTENKRICDIPVFHFARGRRARRGFGDLGQGPEPDELASRGRPGGDAVSGTKPLRK